MLKRIKTYLLYNQNIKFLKVGLNAALNRLYPVIIKIWPLPKIKTIDETIEEIKTNKRSIVRFGDGEVIYLVNKIDLVFQEYDKELAETLEFLLKNQVPGLLVGLIDGYRDTNQFTPEVKKYTRSQTAFNYPRFAKFLNLDTTYWNANITRLYFGFKDQSQCGRQFDMMRSLWEDRDILLIEGEKSRLGVGNDLFANAASVKRILGPPHHAYRRFDDMVATALQHAEENTIALVAMGTTAKAVVYELFKNGIQAIDIGNIDLEYQWYKMGAKERVLLAGRYVSEVKGGRVVADVDDEDYHEQIVAKYLIEE